MHNSFDYAGEMCENAHMRDDWNNLKTVLFMVRHGSLAKAAMALGVSHTTVSRRIADAEAQLGAVLFERLPSGFEPTGAGHEVAARAADMERAVFELERRVDRQEDFEGRLVITAPPLLVSAHLCEVIEAFVAQFPRVELSLLASNDLLNLNANEADLAIRISRNPGEALVGQRLARQETAAFASASVAATLGDAPVNWLGMTHWTSPPLKAVMPGQIKLRFDDMVALVGAAKAGLGVGRMPAFVGRAAGLVQVPVLAPQPYADIWALSHRALKSAPKVRAFRALLVPYFRAHASDFLA